MTDNGPHSDACSWTQRTQGGCVAGGVQSTLFQRFPAAFKGNREIKRLYCTHWCDANSRKSLRIWVPKRSKNRWPSQCFPDSRENEIQTRSKLFSPIWTRKNILKRYEIFSIQRSGWKTHGKTKFRSDIEDFELYNLERIPWAFDLAASETLKALELKSELWDCSWN